MEELISIIIPVYNVEKYLEQCLESVINQTYKNIEIILINDGSTDDSINIMKEYQGKDNRIIIIDRENKGVLYTRLEGIKKSNGKYITYVDSDDWVEKNLIEVLYNKIKKYDSDVVKCEFGNNESIIANGNLNIGQDLFIKKEEFEPLFFDMFFVNMNIHNVWCQMFKKELIYKYIEDVDFSISMGDDLELNIQLYRNINNILFIPDVLYHYRYNDNGITRDLNIDNIINKINDITKVYYNAYKSIDKFNIEDKYKYKRGVITKLLDNVNDYQIDLIGNFKERKKSIEYLKNYYFESEEVKNIRNEIINIDLNIESLKYKIFYKMIFRSINCAYFIATLIWTRRIIKSKLLYKLKKEKAWKN